MIAFSESELQGCQIPLVIVTWAYQKSRTVRDIALTIIIVRPLQLYSLKSRKNNDRTKTQKLACSFDSSIKLSPDGYFPRIPSRRRPFGGLTYFQFQSIPTLYISVGIVMRSKRDLILMSSKQYQQMS